MQSLKKTLLPLLAGAFILAGCDSDGSASSNAKFSLMLTDAPGDFVSAVVSIDRAYLIGGAAGDSSGVDLGIDAVTADLLELQNEVLTLADEVVVPADQYGQLRLVIDGAYVEVEQEDGSTLIYATSEEYADSQDVVADGMLQTPSFDTSGLKINLPQDLGDLEEGEEKIVILDFNVSESFGHQAGQSGMWVMHPVIRATDFAFSGTLALTLALPDSVALPGDSLGLADFAASLDNNGDLLTEAFADVDSNDVYTAEFRYLVPGTYDVDLVAPDTNWVVTTDPEMPIALDVVSTQTTEQEIVITAAE